MLIALTALQISHLSYRFRSSTQQWGGANAMALQLLPTFRLLDDLSGGIYLNLKMRGSPLGLVVGRDARVPFARIDADLGNIAAIEVSLSVLCIRIGSRNVLCFRFGAVAACKHFKTSNG